MRKCVNSMKYRQVSCFCSKNKENLVLNLENKVLVLFFMKFMKTLFEFSLRTGKWWKYYEMKMVVLFYLENAVEYLVFSEKPSELSYFWLKMQKRVNSKLFWWLQVKLSCGNEKEWFASRTSWCTKWCENKRNAWIYWKCRWVSMNLVETHEKAKNTAERWFYMKT